MKLENAKELRRIWKEQGLKVVFTNGCFDILHKGHIYYLREARGLGDRLILGLNSDASVSRLKGPNRPLQNEDSRYDVMDALEMVDCVVIFNEDTPIELIDSLQPDILVKGGDYSLETIVGAEEVLSYGGDVKTLSFIEGYSTTSIEDKIKNS